MQLVRRCIKDPFPALSHWVGVLLSVAALVALLRVAQGRPAYIIGFSIYGGSLIILYLASALSHSIRCSDVNSSRLDRFDLSAIFLLIAGTYTPLCLFTLGSRWGWPVLAAEWVLAAAGIAYVTRVRDHSWGLRIATYVVMGWLALSVAGPVYDALPNAALAWLLGGGVAYSVGAVIFATNRPNLCRGIFEAHDLWHVLVLVGSACHFILIYQFVA